MEVSAQYEDKDTHAIVGSKGQAKQFSISTTPEFIEVLSSSLYPNKPLAVVREVICNAWDAHIAAGKTNIPLNITITDNMFTVQDFGNGIPEDAIEDVYCTYGESTKLKAHDLTGGFGLGTKAPFAITDTFTVINSNNGSRVVYSASKGNDDTDGLPALYEMVRVPSTDTGMTIQVPILPDLRDVIYGLAKKVCHHGEIKANIINDADENGGCKYDGTELGLKNSEMGFVVTSVCPTYSTKGKWYNGNKIFIQYGTVIYPIQNQNEYEDNFIKVNSILTKKPPYTNKYITMNEGYLVIKAEPNTLNVAPSREELSYGKLTNNTISKHLNYIVDINNIYNKQIDIDANLAVRDALMKGWDHDSEGKPSEKEAIKIALDFDNIHASTVINRASPDMVNTMRDYQLYFLFPRTGGAQNHRYQAMTIKAIKQECKKKKYYTAFKLYNKMYKPNYKNYYKNVRRVITNKWMRKLVEKFDSGILHYVYYYDPGNYPDWVKITDKNRRYERSKFCPLTVVISNNKSSIKSYNYRKYDNVVYTSIILPKNQKKYDIDEVTEFLKSHVYDLQAVHMMPQYQPVKTTRAVTKPRKKGYAKLSSCLTDSYQYEHGKFEEADRIEKPTSVALLKKQNHRYTIDSRYYLSYDSAFIKHFLNVFPDTAVVTNRVTGDRLRNKYGINYIDTAYIKWRDNLISFDSTKEELAKHKANQVLIKPLSILSIPEIANEIAIDPAYTVNLSESQIWMLKFRFNHTPIEGVEELTAKYVRDHPAFSLVPKLKYINDEYLSNYKNLCEEDKENVVKLILSVIKG